MNLDLNRSIILPSHRKRSYTLLDALTVQYHGKDDLRWIRGQENFLFQPSEYIGGDLVSCDVEDGDDPTFENVDDGDSFEESAWVSLFSVECSTLSGEGTLSDMERFVGAEHDARLSNHVERQLLSGALNGDTASSLGALAPNLGTVTTYTDIIPTLEGGAASLGGIEALLILPAGVFAAATAAAGVYRDDNGVLRTLTGNILAPHTDGAKTDKAFVVFSPVKVHLSPKNISFPRNWVNVDHNKHYATSEITGMFEMDQAGAQITIALA